MYYILCDGTAKINLVSELLEPTRAHTCGSKAESLSYLYALETMRKIVSQNNPSPNPNHTDKFTTV